MCLQSHHLGLIKWCNVIKSVCTSTCSSGASLLKCWKEKPQSSRCVFTAQTYSVCSSCPFTSPNQKTINLFKLISFIHRRMFSSNCSLDGLGAPHRLTSCRPHASPPTLHTSVGVPKCSTLIVKRFNHLVFFVFIYFVNSKLQKDGKDTKDDILSPINQTHTTTLVPN